MAPGDLFIVDNRRVLHGRSDFKADRRRHLQGCYADRDALHSLLRTIDRESAQAVPNRRGQTSGSRADIVDTLAALYATRGGASYFGDETTVAEHMLQTAAEAGAGGAPDALVAAALLHDVGYLMEAGPTGRKLHQQHSRIGANFLALYFGTDVSEPVRFHVDAKRYLCAAEPGYFERLSNGSVRTLELQGGPMDTAEISAFKSNPHFSEAVQLRAGTRPGNDTVGRCRNSSITARCSSPSSRTDAETTTRGPNPTTPTESPLARSPTRQGGSRSGSPTRACGERGTCSRSRGDGAAAPSSSGPVTSSSRSIRSILPSLVSHVSQSSACIFSCLSRTATRSSGHFLRSA